MNIPLYLGTDLSGIGGGTDGRGIDDQNASICTGSKHEVVLARCIKHTWLHGRRHIIARSHGVAARERSIVATMSAISSGLLRGVLASGESKKHELPQGFRGCKRCGVTRLGGDTVTKCCEWRLNAGCKRTHCEYCRMSECNSGCCKSSLGSSQRLHEGSDPTVLLLLNHFSIWESLWKG
jgi:hypothetical protein